jgi:hypothetical protein
MDNIYIDYFSVYNNEMRKKKEPTKTEEEENENVYLQFIESIEKKLLTRDNKFISITDYSSFIIDGINIDILIRKYDNSYEYVMRTNYITCDKYNMNLIFLDKEEFKTLLDLLNDIKIVMSNYHFLDHRLLSPDELIFAKLQRFFFPLPKCSICYESTNEFTICNHTICFQCRFKCIKLNNLCCPICRSNNLNKFPEELTFEAPYNSV